MSVTNLVTTANFDDIMFKTYIHLSSDDDTFTDTTYNIHIFKSNHTYNIV